MRLLAYTSPARGHLYPIVPILLELRRRGHTVVLRTLASQVSLMRDLGFDAGPVAPEVEQVELDDYRAWSLPGRAIRSLSTFLARADREVPDLRHAIQASRPDVLLIDCMTWGGAAVAEVSGRPWAQYAPYPMPLPSRQAPPYGFGMPPAIGALGRIRDRAIKPVQTAVLDGRVLPRLNELRTRVGARVLGAAGELFVAAPLVLYLTAEPFEYRRDDWPACVRMVGPCCWDPPAGPMPRWLAHSERPLLLISTSSEHQSDLRLVSVAFEAFGDGDFDLVATLPAHPFDRAKLPPNAHLERFLPHAPLLRRAVCAITHGGAGVTQKALAAGVPVCAVPFGRDQYDVARRVEVAGAGVSLPSWRLTPKRLASAVRSAIERQEGAKAIGEAFAAAGGATRAADAILALLR